MRDVIIEIKDLWFSFNSIPVLKEVNLTVHRGDFIALLGPNGGGKTTLLKLILGLLKPDRGSIKVFGKPAG
ncbi:MAG: ATP-binding cassette domain-containing protein, partial [Deltaproteobacteria bacterium]|nr:ATP-binding cassette domain-containing protein [Deltaproteobacteria bacterium]